RSKMAKGTSSFGKYCNKMHTLCRCHGSKAYHLQKSTCGKCGYPAKRKRKYLKQPCEEKGKLTANREHREGKVLVTHSGCPPKTQAFQLVKEIFNSSRESQMVDEVPGRPGGEDSDRILERQRHRSCPGRVVFVKAQTESPEQLLNADMQETGRTDPEGLIAAFC
ncbi:hypothetical protein STEG23_002046, partial [Scotinomys teguina]